MLLEGTVSPSADNGISRHVGNPQLREALVLHDVEKVDVTATHWKNVQKVVQSVENFPIPIFTEQTRDGPLISDLLIVAQQSDSVTLKGKKRRARYFYSMQRHHTSVWSLCSLRLLVAQVDTY